MFDDDAKTTLDHNATKLNNREAELDISESKVDNSETIDDLLLDGLRLIQKRAGFRFTLDSVLLAHFATVKKGDTVVDLGTGTGVIPHILSTRARDIRITGVEIQSDMAEMAERSVQMNGLTGVITIIKNDLRDIHKLIGGGTTTLVTANPPYWAVGNGLPSSDTKKALARHELTCTFEDVVASAAKLLNFQGRFAVIHRAERLPEICRFMREYQLEPRRMRFIHPFVDRPAQHVLLEARKNAAADLKVLPPLIVYREPGKFTAEILRWYGREGNINDA